MCCDPTTLDSEVKRLLTARKGEWPRLCVRAAVSHSWVHKFVRGDIQNPGFATLKRLHGVLTTPDEAATAGGQ